MKENINKYAAEVVQGKNPPAHYKGPILKRQTMRRETNEVGSPYRIDRLVTEEMTPNKEEIKSETEPGQTMIQETKREQMIKISKYNSGRLLYERNKYVFLASVAEDALKFEMKYSNIVAFLLIKKLFSVVTNIKLSLVQKMNIFGLSEWDYYTKLQEYSDIFDYISQEYEVFKVYFEGMHDKLTTDKD